MEDPVEAFRKLTPQQQAKEGEDSLLSHLLEKGIQAHMKHSSLGMDNLDTFLSDSDCTRYPTRFTFEFGAEMAPHQFAQPEKDFRSDNPNAKVIFLRPCLKDRPDLAIWAVIYMMPMVNYGEIIRDEHCLVYASSVMGKTEDEGYAMVCKVADFCGTEVMYQGDNDDEPQSDSGSCGSGGGCG